MKANDFDGYLDLHAADTATLPAPLRAAKMIGTQRALDIFGQQRLYEPSVFEYPAGAVRPRLDGLVLSVNEAVPAGEVWLIDADGNPMARVTGLI